MTRDKGIHEAIVLLIFPLVSRGPLASLELSRKGNAIQQRPSQQKVPSGSVPAGVSVG